MQQPYAPAGFAQQNPMLTSLMRPPVQGLQFLPNIGPIPSQYQSAYPSIVQACLAAVQNAPGRNPLRTYLYNQMSDNGYNNSNFADLVGFCVKAIDYYIKTGANAQNINQLISEVIERCVTQFAAMNMANNPNIQSMLDQQTAFLAMDVVRDHQNLVANIAGNNGQQQRWAQQSYQQPQNPQPTWNQQPQQQTWSQPTQQFQQPFNPQNQMAVSSRWGAQSMSPFSASNSQANRPAQDRYSAQSSAQTYRSNPQPIQASVVPPIQQPINQIPTPSHVANIRAVLDETRGVGRATIKTPLAYDNSLFKDIGTLGNQELVKLQGQEMDLEKHIPTYDAGVVAPVVSVVNQGNNTKLDMNLTKTNKQAKLRLAHKNTNQNNADMDLASVVAEARLNLSVMPVEEDTSNMFRLSGMLYCPYPSMKNFQSLIDSLHRAETFSQAQSILRSERSKVENNNPEARCDNVALTNLNNRLTRAVNSYLKNKLIVENGWMDSFIEDVSELIGFIDNKYGDSFRDALIRDQQSIISSATISFVGDLANIIEEDELGQLITDPAKRPNVVCLADPYVLTSVGLFASELNLTLPDSEIGNVVTEEFAPLFWKIADNSLNDKTHGVKPDEDGVELEINHRHFIVTLDNVVYEVTRGALNPESYVVNRYNFTLN